MTKTALSDLNRSSEMVAATGKNHVSYVRVVNPGACSRCAILAGVYDFKTPFKRHPACKCTSMPIDDGVPDGMYASPRDYFDSLPPAEQDRIFTRAGAESIRLGADPTKVVSARRGARGISYGRQGGGGVGRSMQRTTVGVRPDGSPIQVFTTAEGTTILGSFGRARREAGDGLQRLQGARYRSVKRVRVMPESIIELTDDVELRKTLLRDAGYLDYPISNYKSNAFLAEQRTARLNDRRTADEFYRSLGIAL